MSRGAWTDWMIVDRHFFVDVYLFYVDVLLLVDVFLLVFAARWLQVHVYVYGTASGKAQHHEHAQQEKS